MGIFDGAWSCENWDPNSDRKPGRAQRQPGPDWMTENMDGMVRDVLGGCEDWLVVVVCACLCNPYNYRSWCTTEITWPPRQDIVQIISPCNQYNKNQILLQVLSQSGGCRVIDIAMSLCCLTFTVKGILSGIILCIYLLLILCRLVLSYLVSPNGVLSYLVPSHCIFYILLLCCNLLNHLYLHWHLHLHMICCFGLISYTETSISTYSFFHPSLGAPCAGAWQGVGDRNNSAAKAIIFCSTKRMLLSLVDSVDLSQFHVDFMAILCGFCRDLMGNFIVDFMGVLGDLKINTQPTIGIFEGL